MEEQYGIRWPTGATFSFPSRTAAEAALAADGRGVGFLVVHEFERGTSNATKWRRVPTEGTATSQEPRG
jgi:hypothetical protein